jgi:hypothetical protein
MGDTVPVLEERAATRSAISTVRQVIAHQSKYWRCLVPTEARTGECGFGAIGEHISPNPEIEDVPGAERMHGRLRRQTMPRRPTDLQDVIRAYQSHCLYENHKMMNLHIFRQAISKSFDKQVLAT